MSDFAHLAYLTVDEKESHDHLWRQYFQSKDSRIWDDILEDTHDRSLITDQEYETLAATIYDEKKELSSF